MQGSRWVLALALVLTVAGCLSSDADTTSESISAAGDEPGMAPGQAEGSTSPTPNTSNTTHQEASEAKQTDDAESAASVRLEVFHGHAELHLSGPVALSDASVEPADGDWNRPVPVSNGSATIVPFLEPNRSYEISYRAVLNNGTVWQNQSRIETEPAPAELVSVEEARIHPGARYQTEGGGSCTLSFIVRGPTNETLYALSAGHCVISNGERARDVPVFFSPNEPTSGVLPTYEPERFGVAEMAVHSEDPSQDWALIAIDDDQRGNVSSTVPRWGGPVGLARGPVETGDPACYYGHAAELSSVEQARGRCSSVAWVRAAPPEGGGRVFMAGGPAWAGDSGAPVLDMEHGTALAHVAGGSFVEHSGPSVCATLVFLEAEIGHRFRLVPGAEPAVVSPEVPGLSPSDDPNPMGFDPYSCPAEVLALDAET